MATDEDVCCFCFVVSVFVAFRTKQLCSCFVASVFLLMLLLFLMQLCSLAPSLARSLGVFFNLLTIILHKKCGCIHNSLDNNTQLKHNKHTYIRYTIAIMSYSSRNTISIHYISICIHIFEKKRGIIRHDRL